MKSRRSMTISACFLIGPLLVAGQIGCDSVPLMSEEKASEPAVREEKIATFKNSIDSTLKVTFYLSKRSEGADSGNILLKSGPTYVPAGKETTFSVPALSGRGLDLVPPADRLLRLKVETLVPTWKEPQPLWIEIVSTLPATVRAGGSKQLLNVTAVNGELAIIPSEHQPRE